MNVDSHAAKTEPATVGPVTGSQERTLKNYSTKPAWRMSSRQDPQPLTATDVSEILKYVPSRPTYTEWIVIIAAVGAVLTESEAVAVLSAWSPEERTGEYARKLRSRCQRIGIGSLIEIAKRNGFDALAFARRRSDRASMPSRLTTAVFTGPAARTAAKTELLPPMPGIVNSVWNEGIEYLRTNPRILEKIDSWRSWPKGTAATLLEDGLLASVITFSPKRGLAFPVQAPERCEFGFVQTRQIGFHVRHKPKDGEKAPWSFHPNQKQDAQATPALPFVIGAGFASFASTVIVCEGQWDALTLAAAAGWLVNDASWPEYVILFGTRGAGGWRGVWDHWRLFLPAGVAFVLFPDADEAGSKWTAPGKFRDTLVAAGHPVRVIRSQTERAKDLNDLHRLAPLKVDEIGTWLGKGERA